MKLTQILRLRRRSRNPRTNNTNQCVGLGISTLAALPIREPNVMNLLKKHFLIPLAGLLPLMVSAHAETLHVPADYGRIQDAINAADPGDTILVAPGTYGEALTLEREGPCHSGVRRSHNLHQPECLGPSSVHV